MLLGLEIRDILIIDRLELAFQPGLNVLTGETGAGKSILLDSLGFVLGWRGRAELVRKGASQGEVTAEFDLPANHPARAVLAEAGIACEDTLILRRVNTVEGRKTATQKMLCMCAETSVGVVALVAGLALLGIGLEERVTLTGNRVTALVAALLAFGFVAKDYVLVLRRVEDHGTISVG